MATLTLLLIHIIFLTYVIFRSQPLRSVYFFHVVVVLLLSSTVVKTYSATALALWRISEVIPRQIGIVEK